MALILAIRFSVLTVVGTVPLVDSCWPDLGLTILFCLLVLIKLLPLRVDAVVNIKTLEGTGF